MKNALVLKYRTFPLLLALLCGLQWASAQSKTFQLQYHINNQVDLSLEFDLKSKNTLSVKTIITANQEHNGRSDFGGVRNATRRYTDTGAGVAVEYRRYLLLDKGQSMRGIYAAAQVAGALHRLDYTLRKPGSGAPGLFGGTAYLYSTGTVSTPLATAVGKLGFQKRWGNFSLDVGGSLSYGETFRSTTILSLDELPDQDYSADVEGLRSQFYVGIGCAF